MILVKSFQFTGAFENIIRMGEVGVNSASQILSFWNI